LPHAVRTLAAYFFSAAEWLFFALVLRRKIGFDGSPQQTIEPDRMTLLLTL
jgi:hypothetical protein